MGISVTMHLHDWMSLFPRSGARQCGGEKAQAFGSATLFLRSVYATEVISSFIDPQHE
jgi:hypothetical protein